MATVLDAYAALAKVEAGLALLRPTDELPDDVTGALRQAGDALFPPVPVDDEAELAPPSLSDLVPLFPQWEIAVLTGLRSLASVYHDLSPEDQQKFWCAISAVPRPGVRGQQPLSQRVRELREQLEETLTRHTNEPLAHMMAVVLAASEGSEERIPAVSTRHVTRAEITKRAAEYVHALARQLHATTEELASLKGRLYDIYRRHAEAQPVRARTGTGTGHRGWQRLAAPTQPTRATWQLPMRSRSASLLSNR